MYKYSERVEVRTRGAGNSSLASGSTSRIKFNAAKSITRSTVCSPLSVLASSGAHEEDSERGNGSLEGTPNHNPIGKVELLNKNALPYATNELSATL